MAETTEPLRRSVNIDGPYDMRGTFSRLHLWGGGPCMATGSDEIWRATRTPQGPSTTLYRRTLDGIDVFSWGPGAAWSLEAAPGLVGAHDNPADFAPDHPLLRDLHKRRMGLRFGRTGQIMDRVLPVIIGQKVTTVGAKASWRELVWRYGEPAPGPLERLMLPPDPEVLATVPAFRLVPCNIEGKRASILREASFRRKRLEEAATMDVEGAMNRLQALRGIGPWTATLTVSVSHGDPDLPWIGDYNLPNAVAFHLAGEPRGDDDRMLELLEPFRPHRARALQLLKMAGKAPRFAPRGDVRNIRGF